MSDRDNDVDSQRGPDAGASTSSDAHDAAPPAANMLSTPLAQRKVAARLQRRAPAAGDPAAAPTGAAPAVEPGGPPAVVPAAPYVAPGGPPAPVAVPAYVAPGGPPAPVAVAPVAVAAKAADFRAGAALEALSLSAFETYAREQADWSTGPTVGASKDKLFHLLELARGDEAFLAGCGSMNVHALLATGLDAKALAHLRSYCGAVHKDRQTVEVEPITDVADAMRMGEALPKLEATPGGLTIKTIMKQTAAEPQLKDMLAEGAVEPFIKYVQAVHPVLQAPGEEIRSYLAMRREGVDPAAVKPAVPRIRNLHRFEKGALDRLAANETDTSKTKPLTLILHSALDHNGAFHRDPNLTQAVRHLKNNTLMIEGKETLEQVQSEIGPLAKKYGRGDKLDQVMFAGHGASRVIELAGTVAPGIRDGTPEIIEHGDDVDLDRNTARTEALFEELMKHMDPASQNHRVIFNACLTNSNAVDAPLADDPVTAKAQIKDTIARKASLATTFKMKAKAKGSDLDSRGANGSIGPIGLIDAKSGRLDLVSREDPTVTADKIVYVESGIEPEGVMRAVVEEWGRDSKACLETMKRRQTRAVPTAWGERLIHAMFSIILKGHDHDAALMNRFADGASAIGEAQGEEECRVSKIAGALPAAWVGQIYAELAHTEVWAAYNYIPLVFEQDWLAHDATVAPKFLTLLGTRFNCHTASRFVDMTALAPQIGTLLPMPPAATPSAGQLTLALLDVAMNHASANPHTIAWLQALLGTSRWYAKTLNVIERLGGLATETEILDGIGRGTKAAPVAGAKTPDANVDTAHTGTNDLYVEPMTKTSKINVMAATVFDKPDAVSKKLGTLVLGAEVSIMGKSGAQWFAIEHAGKTAFISVADVAP